MFKRTHKYNATKVEIDGIKFDSKLESKVYEIFRDRGLTPELQTTFEIQESFRDGSKLIRAINYKADFVINYNGTQYVVDAKGMLLPEAKLKYKLLLRKGVRILYVKSQKAAVAFCEMLFEGKTPREIEEVLSAKPKKDKKPKK